MSVDLFGCLPGPSNSLMDVAGLGLGHAVCDDGEGDSGVSVIVAPGGAVASVDVRGGGPGTRETDLLSPENTVQSVHAIALCGGSAFGLDATAGVMRELESQGIGFAVLGSVDPTKKVPIVPAAVIFDLLLGDWGTRPDAQTGSVATARALEALRSAEPSTAQGNVGAGVGATAGALKGGFGQASAVFPEGTPLAGRVVSAAIVVNPQGTTIDPETGLPWGLVAQRGQEFTDAYDLPEAELPGGERRALREMNLLGTKILPDMVGVQANLNTTIGVVATDAPLSKAQAKRLALSSHDGLARAIRPAHMPMDGDTLFALSTAPTGPAGEGVACGPLELSMLASVAANCVERAVVHAVLSATSRCGVASWNDARRRGAGE